MIEKKFEKRPSPRETDIIAALKHYNAPVKLKELYKYFKLRKPEQEARLDEMVDRLVIEGKLKYMRDFRVVLSSFMALVQEFTVVKVTHDGLILGQPWEDSSAADYTPVKASHQVSATLTVGTRFMGKMEHKPHQKERAYIKFIRLVEDNERVTLGVFDRHPITLHGRIHPVQKGEYPFTIDEHLCGTLKSGDLIAFSHGTKAHIELLGNVNQPKTLAMLAIREHKIPTEFPELAFHECDNLPPLDEAQRTDLRHLKLITIDGEDAKDFDDAVYAVPHEEGWRIVVAIADVSYYVPVGSALDREAFHRGNSVYFPGTVVPMLPPALSNGICSLMPEVDRACLVSDMVINLEGKIISSQFYRAVMHSKARMTYHEVQHILDGKETTHPLYALIENLKGAYDVLRAARVRRGTLDLDITEKKIIFAQDDTIDRIETVSSLTSHKIIEECMILANVSAAVFLEKHGQKPLYRIHDSPPHKKIIDLEKNLKAFYQGPVKSSKKFFTHLLGQFHGTPHERTVSEIILRAQSQAVYSPYNVGHFGLSLKRYCHFTSPIRRYADLVVHRALINALGLGEGPTSLYDLEAVGHHISTTERRAAAAERETSDRLAAVYLSRFKDQTFQGWVTGIHKAGLFVRILPDHIDGLIPFRSIGDDLYIIDEGAQQVVGKRTRVIFSLGDAVEVGIKRIDPLVGQIDFELVDHKPQFAPSSRKERVSLGHGPERRGNDRKAPFKAKNKFMKRKPPRKA